MINLALFPAILRQKRGSKRWSGGFTQRITLAVAEQAMFIRSAFPVLPHSIEVTRSLRLGVLGAASQGGLV